MTTICKDSVTEVDHMAKKERQSSNLNEVLKKVASFINDLEKSLTDAPALFLKRRAWMSFSRGEDGGLELSGAEVEQYHVCLDSLTSVVNADKISKKALDGYFKDTILAALDINKRRIGKTFDQRLDAAIAELKKKLTAEATPWRVYYRISGLEPTFEPDTFGKIRLVVFDENHFDSFKEAMRQHIKDEEIRNLRIQHIHELTEAPLAGKTVAIIEVHALDADAARNQALKELQLTLDVINFYSDILYPSKSAFASVYGEEERAWEVVPIFIPGDEPILLQSQKAIGRLSNFSMHELLHGKGHKLGVTRISAILAKNSRSTIEERLLSAVQWAGRATIDQRNEEAFLLYAIALECLVMERGNEPELGYRLRMRIAHLLGKDLDTRKEIRSAVGRLYGIRSAIVHKGEYVIPESELKLMRFFAKESIMQMLIKEPFTLMQSDSELLAWFDDQLLN
jgi:hypothetical protein